MVDLLELGYNVLTPMVAGPYDMIAHKDGKSWTVQVKTGRLDQRNTTLKASWDAPYDPLQVDVLAVVDPSDGTIYYIPVEDLPNDRSVTIRFEPTNRDTSSFLASDLLYFPGEEDVNAD